MIEIESEQSTPTLHSLFRSDAPQARRCFAVLDHVGHTGCILTDDPDRPTWGAIWEVYDGTTFLAGNLDAAVIAEIIALLRLKGEVVICMWPEDPRLDLLPVEPSYEGWGLEFYDRPVGQGLDVYTRQFPAGCELRRLDRDLIMRTQWGPDDVRFAGGLDAWEETCIGYCLLRGDEVLCESTVGPAAIGLREPGVITQEDHRGKGYATMTSARLIQEIEGLGEHTYWNCAKQNIASAAVARKLGYRVEKEFRCIAWTRAG